MLIAPEGREEETIIRLSRVGFDNTLGFLDGGFEAWKKASKEYDSITSIPAITLQQIIEDHKNIEETPIFDVRKETEFEAGHVVGSFNVPLDFMNDYLAAFPKDKTFYVYCLGGYRSITATSILKSRGIHNLIEIKGGFETIVETDIPVTNYLCPTTHS